MVNGVKNGKQIKQPMRWWWIYSRAVSVDWSDACSRQIEKTIGDKVIQ